MKKALLFTFLVSTIVSCNNTKPPTDVAKEFIQAISSSDASTASRLATEKTKANVGTVKGDAPGMTAEESFSLNTMTETITGNTAEVRNEVIKLSLEKEDDGWKVNASPELVAGISNRQKDLATLKQKWEALLKEYDGRLNVAREYVSYKKGQGAISPQIKTLEEMINTLSAKTVWNKEKILLYVQKQKQFQDLVDKALEPSANASADMSMNYILQVNEADSRIKTAKAEYQASAEKTSSGTYPVLSPKETTSIN